MALITVTVDRPLRARLGETTAGGTVGTAFPLHPAADGQRVGTSPMDWIGKVVGLTAQPDLSNGTAMQRVNMNTTSEL